MDVELRITTTRVPLADRNGACHRNGGFFHDVNGGRFEVFLVMRRLPWSSMI